ncbi:MAG: 3-oxoacyl-[acyl-carrier protein] reductase [Alphaproteobacteria bacterium]|jgi:3-oxoacyl-[acyl-carrier protein] reductase|nr:3-oxoacyl-[acyl-carrier protein] reductase [Alphaproteobacteria bacterium]
MRKADMRNIVVTGGSRGLGLGIARQLAAAGYRVITVARKSNKQLASAIEDAERAELGELHFVAFDLSDIKAIPGLVQHIRKDFGPIYGLINNAAIGTDGVLAIMHNSQIEELVRINTVSPIVLTKYAVRSMLSEGGGRIVNVASIIGFTGYSGLSVYGATKASMIGFTRSLAREVGRHGVNVNAVAPGFIETDLTQGMGAEQRGQVARRSALRRLAEVDDVANAVEFLLGDKAKNITGTVMTVDAGSTA